MDKVYLVFAIYEDKKNSESYTRVVHVCKDKDLAVEYANKYVNDDIHDFLKGKHDGIILDEVEPGKYLSESDLINDQPTVYITTFVDDNFSRAVAEQFSIVIEAHEVRED